MNQIRAEQIKTNQKVDDVNKRVDDLYYNEDEYEEEHDNDDYQSDNEQAHVDDHDEQNDPVAKKQRVEETRFSSLKKFRSGEKCDTPIDASLAENVTEIFRKGISEERYKDLLKSDKTSRPENCEGLTTVQTNQMIWNCLFPLTKTNDTKMKHLQTILVKGATVLTKVVNELDKINQKLGNEALDACCDDAMDALALFGQANYKLCLTRREFMKRDADDRYVHLFTESTPIDKYLFGGDVSKTLTEIGICNRISRKIERGTGRSNYRGWSRRGRGSYRGRGPRGTRGRPTGGRVPEKSDE